MDSLAVDGFSRGSLEKIEHLLSEAKRYKEEGNLHYQAKDYRKAIRCYHKSLLYIKSITQVDPLVQSGQDSVGTLLGVNQKEALPNDVQQNIAKLSRDCHNNLAACIMCKDDPDYNKVITYCNLVIDGQPNNPKAYFRKGVSLYHLKDFDKALHSFLRAKDFGGGSDSQVIKYINLCHEAIRTENDKLKSTYQNMFKQPAT